MKRNSFLYIIAFLLFSCQPAKRNLSSSTHYIEIQSQTEEAAVNKIIEPYKAAVDAEMNNVIGVSDVAMPKTKDLPETLLGNFVADLVFEFSKTIDKETDFAVLNNGGLRSSLPSGNITVRNIYELMPFDNEIVIVTLDGANVQKIFSYIAEKGGVPVAGVTVKLEKMNGTIVPSYIMVGKEKFSREQTYQIATSDYLANGGDNMNFWSTGSMQTTSKKLRDAIIDHIRFKTDNQLHLNPTLDNRISYLVK